MVEFDMEDLVIYAIDTRKDSKTKGKEMPGTLVRLFRLPKKEEARTTGRCSGPWQHVRGGFNAKFKWREVGGTKNRVPRKELEPCVDEMVPNLLTRTSSLIPMTLQPDSYPTKPTAKSGTIIAPDGTIVGVFGEDNAKYIESVCLFHYRHGSLSYMDDEASDAVYAEDLPKLKALVGKTVFWEFRPYVKTIAGGASGVDEYRMAVANATDEPVESK